MDYTEFVNALRQYTEYSMGDLDKKCELKYEDEEVANFDFSKYDLNNSFFVGTKFNSCDLTDVYLSGSFFGGSIFDICKFENNRLVKAAWDYTSFVRCTIKSLYAHKTDFFHAKLIDCKLIDCVFKAKVHLFDSEFSNTSFMGCAFGGGTFDGSKFNKVDFSNCYFMEQTFFSAGLTSTTFNSCQFEKIHFIDWIYQRDELKSYQRKPIFDDVIFKNCQFTDCDLPDDFDVEKAASSEGFCYSSSIANKEE